MRFRISIDLVMTTLMLLAFAYQLTGNTVHEVIGVSLLFLLIAHSILNWRWYGRLFKGRYGLRRMANMTINLLLLVIFVVLLITGMMNSHLIFAFSQVDTTSSTRQIHTLAGYWFLILMSVHLGMHWKMIMAEIRKMAGITSASGIRTIFLRVLSLLIVADGIYASFDRNIFAKLIDYYSFEYWNFDGNVAGFFCEYIAIMGFYVCVTHYVLNFIQESPQSPKKCPACDFNTV